MLDQPFARDELFLLDSMQFPSDRDVSLSEDTLAHFASLSNL